MNLSGGLIYALLVVLWAVVLVPIWLRRHDEVTESRSVDRFQGAMRTLSRRSAASVGDRREIVLPRRGPAHPMPDGVVDARTPAQLAAARRRTAGLVMLAVVVIVGGLAALHLLPIWAPAIPLVILVFFVVRARAAARRLRERELAARRAKATQARRLRREESERELVRSGAPVARRREPAEIEQSRPAARRPVAAAVAQPTPAQIAAPSFYDAEADRAWDPVPVPLPTYVSAPKAPRSVRIIDLTLPGAWTSGRLPTQRASEQEDANSEPAEAVERDGIVTGELLIERLRAVGD